MHPVSKYLARYAEPEVGLASAVDGRYDRALVVPAFREEPSFVDGFVEAAETSPGRTLAIVVVNAPADAIDEAHAENARLLAGLRHRLGPTRSVSSGARIGSASARLDVLVLDRASEGVRLPPKQGVGLARKIGADLALALRLSGTLASDWVFGTDADATLPEAHFDLRDVEGRAELAAVVFPFWHDATADGAVTRATALYELSLRYYVAGLAWAGSPYAFHVLGSATAVSGTAYAKVRGYPKREAAEDFYLLNKLAKVGPVLRGRGAAVRIRSRVSARTPFGTGRRVTDALLHGDRDFYSPDVFVALGRVLAAIEGFPAAGDVDRLFADLGDFPAPLRDVALATFERFGARFEFEAARRETKAPEARRRRAHAWFDAFRTLKFVHAVRDRFAPSVPWQIALANAPFRIDPSCAGDVDAARAELERFERELPRVMGPTVPLRPRRGAIGT